MPANLTPQYFKAEERYRQATTDAEKLAALRDMLSQIPKHKGTEKLQADLKKKIADLRKYHGRKTGGHRAAAHQVERSGAAQVALVGPHNAGKSRFVRDLTHATPEVAEFPGTTWTPTPGIVLVDQIPLQVVDLPALHAEHVEPWHLDLVRNADLLLVMLDLGSDDLLDDWAALKAGLDACRITLGATPPAAEREVGRRYHDAVLAANRADLPGAEERLLILDELTTNRQFVPCSLETGEGIDRVLREMVSHLDLLRVYTKEPHGEADMNEPFVVRRGATVADVARLIHKDLAEHLKFTRAWGERFHDGQPVGKDQELEDGDVLEFHQG